MRRTLPCLFVAIALLVATGCTSTPVRMDTFSDQPYEEIGPVKATASGFMLFGFIPIRHNSRFHRAYEACLERSGGDGLVNPVITERWYWAWVGNGYITTIQGTAVQATDE